MSEESDDFGTETPGAVAVPRGTDPDSAGVRDFVATRRRLMLGAASASAVVTIRPALAGTMGSISTCEVQVPDQKLGRGKWIASNGAMVDAGTPGAFRGPYRPLTGEQIKKAMAGANFPGADYETSRAYMAYIRKLQNGMSGFTCYQSLQMPRT
jgi:hypothetical protein